MKKIMIFVMWILVGSYTQVFSQATDFREGAEPYDRNLTIEEAVASWSGDSQLTSTTCSFLDGRISYEITDSILMSSYENLSKKWKTVDEIFQIMLKGQVMPWNSKFGGDSIITAGVNPATAEIVYSKRLPADGEMFLFIQLETGEWVPFLSLYCLNPVFVKPEGPVVIVPKPPKVEGETEETKTSGNATATATATATANGANSADNSINNSYNTYNYGSNGGGYSGGYSGGYYVGASYGYGSSYGGYSGWCYRGTGFPFWNPLGWLFFPGQGYYNCNNNQWANNNTNTVPGNIIINNNTTVNVIVENNDNTVNHTTTNFGNIHVNLVTDGKPDGNPGGTGDDGSTGDGGGPGGTGDGNGGGGPGGSGGRVVQIGTGNMLADIQKLTGEGNTQKSLQNYTSAQKGSMKQQIALATSGKKAGVNHAPVSVNSGSIRNDIERITASSQKTAPAEIVYVDQRNTTNNSNPIKLERISSANQQQSRTNGNSYNNANSQRNNNVVSQQKTNGSYENASNQRNTANLDDRSNVSTQRQSRTNGNSYNNANSQRNNNVVSQQKPDAGARNTEIRSKGSTSYSKPAQSNGNSSFKGSSTGRNYSKASSQRSGGVSKGGGSSRGSNSLKGSISHGKR